MKSLISINYKFMGIHPKELVNMILESKYTKGVEVYIDVNKEDELNYLDKLVYEIKRNNLILQIHGEISLDIEKQLSFIKILENYSDILNMPIVFTLHTVYNEDEKISIDETARYLAKLANKIDNNKIIISLENLNDARGLSRLSKEDITTTILNDENIFFTYDIGHEIADFGSITDLNEYVIKLIRNTHIHSNNGRGVDHMPIYKNDQHWNELLKGITFLNINKYKYNIVFEYGLEYCKGNTIEEKIKDYLSSIDFVSERINNI